MTGPFGALLLLAIERTVAASFNLGLLRWIGLQTLLFSIIPLLLISIGKIKPEEVGLSAGDLGFGLKIVALMLILAMPFMVYGAGLASFKWYYPIWAPARESLSNLIFLELAVLLMMFNTEFIFRGLLLFSLENETRHMRHGQWTAIFAHSIIYMLAHMGKPSLEVPYSFFVGLAFGWLALRTRSIFPSLIAHWTSSVLFDILVIML